MVPRHNTHGLTHLITINAQQAYTRYRTTRGRGTEELIVLGSTQEQHPRQDSEELYRLVNMYINI